VDPRLTHKCWGRSHTPMQMAARSAHAHFMQLHHKIPIPHWLQWAAPHSPRKLALPVEQSPVPHPWI